MRLVTYNLGQGGSRDPAVWVRVLPILAPSLLFVQESRNPTQCWLPGLADTRPECLHWVGVPDGRWGSGLWVRDGRLTPLAVPDDYTGRVSAALVEGCAWPTIGVAPVLAISVHAPTRKGSSYLKEVARILDFAAAAAAGLPLILGGDFNVAVGLRQPGQPIGTTSGEQALIARLRDELGLLPCWQTANPGAPLARTLRWLRRNDSLPYHCDGLFMPSAWAAALRCCEVLENAEWCALSDHNPVVATFDVAAP